MKFKLIVAVAAAVSLSACASIVSGSDQDVSFMSDSMQGRTCTATGGSEFSVNETFTLPATVNVPRSKKALEVNCGGTKKTVLGKFNAWTLGNFFNLTGLVGIGIDAATGAVHKYPDTVNLDTAPAAP